MDQIYPAVRESDVVVLASPLYYWNLSGQLRTAMDRRFALEENDGNLLRGHDRFGVLLMAAEGHEFEDVQAVVFLYIFKIVAFRIRQSHAPAFLSPEQMYIVLPQRKQSVHCCSTMAA